MKHKNGLQQINFLFFLAKFFFASFLPHNYSKGSKYLAISEKSGFSR